MEKRYIALRIIGTIYKVLGTIVAVLTILTALGLCATSIFGGAAMDSLGRQFGSDTSFLGFFSGIVGGLILAVGAILYGGFLAITFFAFGEGIYLLLALEENTRVTAVLLQRQNHP